jgi:hypothetical protein
MLYFTQDGINIKEVEKANLGRAYDGWRIPTKEELVVWEKSKEPTYQEKRKPLYEKDYSDGDVKDIIMKQFNYMRMNGQDLIQEADDWVGSCLAVKAKVKKE